MNNISCMCLVPTNTSSFNKVPRLCLYQPWKLGRTGLRRKCRLLSKPHWKLSGIIVSKSRMTTRGIFSRLLSRWEIWQKRVKEVDDRCNQINPTLLQSIMVVSSAPHLILYYYFLAPSNLTLCDLFSWLDANAIKKVSEEISIVLNEFNHFCENEGLSNVETPRARGSRLKKRALEEKLLAWRTGIKKSNSFRKRSNSLDEVPELSDCSEPETSDHSRQNGLHSTITFDNKASDEAEDATVIENGPHNPQSDVSPQPSRLLSASSIEPVPRLMISRKASLESMSPNSASVSKLTRQQSFGTVNSSFLSPPRPSRKSPGIAKSPESSLSSILTPSTMSSTTISSSAMSCSTISTSKTGTGAGNSVISRRGQSDGSRSSVAVTMVGAAGLMIAGDDCYDDSLPCSPKSTRSIRDDSESRVERRLSIDRSHRSLISVGSQKTANTGTVSHVSNESRNSSKSITSADSPLSKRRHRRRGSMKSLADEESNNKGHQRKERRNSCTALTPPSTLNKETHRANRKERRRSSLGSLVKNEASPHALQTCSLRREESQRRHVGDLDIELPSSQSSMPKRRLSMTGEVASQSKESGLTGSPRRSRRLSISSSLSSSPRQHCKKVPSLEQKSHRRRRSSISGEVASTSDRPSTQRGSRRPGRRSSIGSQSIEKKTEISTGERDHPKGEGKSRRSRRGSLGFLGIHKRAASRESDRRASTESTCDTRDASATHASFEGIHEPTEVNPRPLRRSSVGSQSIEKKTEISTGERDYPKGESKSRRSRRRSLGFFGIHKRATSRESD